MVDISNIGRNLNLDSTVAAGAAQSAGKSKAVRRRPLAEGKGIGLEDIPEQSPYVPVQDATIQEEEVSEATETVDTAPVYNEEENTEMLAKIDYELATLQAMIKKVISKKIALADKNDESRHQLLLSAFEDCKSAYTKVREVRDFLG